MKSKRLLAMLLAVLLLIGNQEIAFAQGGETKQYKDLSGHWAKEKIEYLRRENIVGEDISTSQSFMPEQKITRAESVELMLKATLPREVLLGELKSVEENNSFSDTGKHKLKNYLESAYKFSIAKGYKDGSFHPDEVITREEFATILLQSQDVLKTLASEKDEAKTFSDVPSDRWSYPYIINASKVGLINGYKDGSFRPSDTITRAEAYTMTYNYYTACFVDYNGAVGFVSSGKKALEGATAELVSSKENKIVQLVKTDKYGQYRFPKVEKGEYSIKISYKEKAIEKKGLVFPLKPALIKDVSDMDKVGEVPPAKKPSFSGGGGGGGGASGGSTSDSSGGGLSENIKISVNEVQEGVYQTNEEKISLSGTVSSKHPIASLRYKIKSVKSEEEKIVDMPASEVWSIEDLPVDIGTNYLTIEVLDDRGNMSKREVLIDRINKEVLFSENVTIPQEDEIEEISSKLINYYYIDNGTETPEDDYYAVVGEKDNPLFLGYGSQYHKGEIVYLPPNEHLKVGAFMKIREVGKPSELVGLLPTEKQEGLTEFKDEECDVLYMEVPSFGEVYSDDVRIHSDMIDEENPVAFAYLPEDSELKVSGDTFYGRGFVSTAYDDDDDNDDDDDDDDDEGNDDKNKRGKWKNKGFLRENLKDLIPKFNMKRNNRKTEIGLKFGEAILFDRDGKKDTNSDQIKLEGEMKLKDIYPQVGLEWHPVTVALHQLPEQLYFKTTWQEENNVKLKFGSGTDTTELMRGLNKTLNGNFENKAKLMGVEVEGISLNDEALIGVIGLNLSGTVIVGMQNAQKASIPMNPILVIALTVNMKGEIKAKTSLEYSHSTYYEKGFNLQKKDFVGKWGSLRDNRGQKSIDIPFSNRSLEIYDIEAQSPSNKNDPPKTKVELKSEGEAGIKGGLGVMAGVMIGGFMPGRIKAQIYVKDKLKFVGSLIFENNNPPVVYGSGKNKLEVGVEGRVDLRFLLKMFKRELAKVEWKYTIGKVIYEKEDIFGEFNINGISGRVFKDDGTGNVKNKNVLDNVLVEMYRDGGENTDMVASTRTNSSGDFKIPEVIGGKYKLVFKLEGYKTAIAIIDVKNEFIKKKVYLKEGQGEEQILLEDFSKEDFEQERENPELRISSLSESGAIKAYWDKDSRVLTVKSTNPQDKINMDKWVELSRTFHPDNFTKNAYGWANNSDFKLVMEGNVRFPDVAAYWVDGYTGYDSGYYCGFFTRFQGQIILSPDIKTDNVKNMISMFYFAKNANPDVSNWDVSNVTDMNDMFGFAYSATPDVSRWNVSNVTNMGDMFSNAENANPDVSRWNVSNVTNMRGMFSNAENANPDVSNWDVSNVTDMGSMFGGATSANPDVSRWNVSNVTNMGSMFFYAENANPDVSNWDVSGVRNMYGMFFGASGADPDVSDWDVSNVTDMSMMFSTTEHTDPDVSDWDVSNVQNLSGMFSRTKNANPDVSRWDVSKVWDMRSMFWGAKNADPDVSRWDVSNVRYMGSMFCDADSLQKLDLQNWNFNSGVDISDLISSTDSLEKLVILPPANIIINKFAGDYTVYSPWDSDNIVFQGSKYSYYTLTAGSSYRVELTAPGTVGRQEFPVTKEYMEEFGGLHDNVEEMEKAKEGSETAEAESKKIRERDL